MPALSPAEVSTSPSSTKSASGSTSTAGKRARQLPRPGPVGGRAAAVEQAGVGEREGAGADREQPRAAAGGGAQRRQRLLRRRLEDAGVAGDDDGVGPPQRLRGRRRG